jgi:hypothetical protein
MYSEVLSHARRQVIHFNVTANSTAQWTANQVIKTFPWTLRQDI